jgi:O-antigen/teichoic acid export membrane protein
VSALQGMLQGVQRFGALATALLVNAAARLAVGIALVAAGGGVAGALAASVAGSALAVLVPLAVVRPVLAASHRAGSTAGGAAGERRDGEPGSDLRVAALGREVGAASIALLGLLLLANVDLLLGRHYLDPSASGLYAAGAVVAKIAYWAPQFVATIVFPRLAREVAARRRLLAGAAAVVAGLGVAVAVAVAAAPELAVLLPFGAAYRGIGPDLPLFALLGTALALAQLLLFSGIAAGDRRVNLLLGATVAVEVAAIALGPHGSVTGVVATALAVVGALLCVGFLLERRRRVETAG